MLLRLAIPALRHVPRVVVGSAMLWQTRPAHAAAIEPVPALETCAARSFEGQTYLVTGSSRGLGLEFARQLLERGANVVATCRAPERAAALAALAAEPGRGARLRVEQLDTSDAQSIDACAARLAADGVALDGLVNNAGVASKHHPVDPISERARFDGADALDVLRVNVIGTILATNALLPLLAAKPGGARTVVNLSSDLGSIENTFAAQSAKVRPGGVASYRMSKAAQNMATRVFAAELREQGFVVVALSPGWVATDMGSSGGRTAPLTPRQSIAGMLDVISRLQPSHTGLFLKYDATALPF